MNRMTKDEYYLELARCVSERSTCLKRHYGAVIINHDRIISTGYNGAPRGCTNCSDLGKCERMNVPHNTDYTFCRSVHAEMNAIIHASYVDMQDSTLYLSGFDMQTGNLIDKPDCCPMCKRMIINAGITRVVFGNADGSITKVNVNNDWVCDESVLMPNIKTSTKTKIIHKIIDMDTVVLQEFNNIKNQGNHNFVTDEFKKVFYIYKYAVNSKTLHTDTINDIGKYIEENYYKIIDTDIEEYRYEYPDLFNRLQLESFIPKFYYAMYVRFCQDYPDLTSRNININDSESIKEVVDSLISLFWINEVIPNYEMG